MNRRGRWNLARSAAGVLAALAALAGCASDPSRGYAFASAYDAEVRTVAVPVFRNRTMEPGIEVDLTEAVIKEIQRRTPWRVTSEENADTTLTGVITGLDLRSLSVGRRTGLTQEMAVILAVEFAWVDNRTGRPIVTRENFRASETFVPARRTGERPELGHQATVQELARQIVAELRSNW